MSCCWPHSCRATSRCCWLRRLNETQVRISKNHQNSHTAPGNQLMKTALKICTWKFWWNSPYPRRSWGPQGGRCLLSTPGQKPPAATIFQSNSPLMASPVDTGTNSALLLIVSSGVLGDSWVIPGAQGRWQDSVHSCLHGEGVKHTMHVVPGSPPDPRQIALSWRQDSWKLLFTGSTALLLTPISAGPSAAGRSHELLPLSLNIIPIPHLNSNKWQESFAYRWLTKWPSFTCGPVLKHQRWQRAVKNKKQREEQTDPQ